MNRSGVRLEHKRGGDDDEVELVLRLHERGRLFLKAGTEVGGGEGGGVSRPKYQAIIWLVILTIMLICFYRT